MIPASFSAHHTASFSVDRRRGARHGSLSLIEKTYGHLLEVRHRSAVVEYREVRVVPFLRRAEGGLNGRYEIGAVFLTEAVR